MPDDEVSVVDVYTTGVAYEDPRQAPMMNIDTKAMALSIAGELQAPTCTAS